MIPRGESLLPIHPSYSLDSPDGRTLSVENWLASTQKFGVEILPERPNPAVSLSATYLDIQHTHDPPGESSYAVYV
jgi:hypothetical protein